MKEKNRLLINNYKNIYKANCNFKEDRNLLTLIVITSNYRGQKNKKQKTQQLSKIVII